MSDLQHYNCAPKDGPDAIAERCQRDVKLTKFQSFTGEQLSSQISLQIDQTPAPGSPTRHELADPESPSSVAPPGSKWPWSAKTKTSFELTNYSNNNTNNNETDSNSINLASQQSREPFQVVWRNLSFEAPLNTYDRLLVKALNGFRTLLPHSSINQTLPDQQLDSKYELDRKAEPNPRFGQKLLIFDNMNGYVNSGEISAILGPSGAGKTSLLNAICGRGDNYRGSVQLIGRGKYRTRLSIIPQKDYLIENLTVRENLLYSSRILIVEPNFDHEANILRVVKMLNLTNCFKSSVSKISGGEYKRVSIAQELLRQPDILILDEPTSGLDSLNCKNLIKSLTKLIDASRQGAIQPIAIMMTIHQPDVEVFQMFDHVYCMGLRGRVIYDGHPRDTLDVIRSQAGLPEHMFPDAKESSKTINPANLLIEIASEELYGSEPVERLARYQWQQFEQLCSGAAVDLGLSDELGGAEGTTISKSNSHSVPNLPIVSVNSNATYMSQPDSKKSNSSGSLSSSVKKVDHLVRDKRLTPKSEHSGQLLHHTNILARRAFASTIRDPLMTMAALVFHLSIPFVMWTVYPKQVGTVGACPLIQHEFDMVSMMSNNSLNKIADLQHQLIFAMECGTMFFITCYAFSMCSLAMAALAFPMNMHVLLKEVRNGWYSLPCYVVAKTIANFPFEVIFPVMSLMMIYLLLGMPESYMHWRLWAIALAMALISMISHTNGFIFGALFMDSVQSAIFLSISSTLPLILLSGYTSRIKYMPQILQNLSWFSPYRYSSEAISIVRFGFGICPCDESTDEYLRDTVPTFSDIPQRARPLFSYYLANSAPGDEEAATTTLASNLVENITTTLPTIVNTAANALVNHSRKIIPGVTRELVLDGDARRELLKKIETNEIDIFQSMADLMARSFSFGRKIESCQSVRSELLSTLGIPSDNHLPWAFGGLVVLFVVTKVMLFTAVKYKIGSRI